MHRPDPAGDLRAYLFANTREQHDRVDRAAGRSGLQPVEDGLNRAGAERIFEDWPRRQRLAVLRRDLHRLGTGEPAARPGMTFRSNEQIWGALYVLEGSRLGVNLIRRNLPGVAMPEFFRPEEPGLWSRFLERLRRADTGRHAHLEILDGARLAFGAFLG